MTTPLDPHASGQRARRGARPARAQRPRRACPAARAASTAQVVVYVPGRYKAVGVSETSGAGGTTRQLRIRVAWLSPRAGMGCMLSLGLAVLCGANLHEIVERLVEGEGGGGGRGCADGRFALAVAGQACSCRHARHGRLVFVGALVAFLAKKRVKNRRGSTNGQNSPFLGLRKSNSPKTVLASGAGNQKKTQTGWLSAFCSRAIGAENER